MKNNMDKTSPNAENANGEHKKTGLTGRFFKRDGFILGLFLSIIIMIISPDLREFYYTLANRFNQSVPAELSGQEAIKLKRNIENLKHRYNRLIPYSPYMIVNTSGNEFYLKKGLKELYRGVCSTGSYTLLKARDERQWIFKTPRGMFRVQTKLVAPVWKMPDWAFIEEGLPVPPPNASERFEYGVLGDYALSFGKGYLVHGTLYKRMLGMPVTHGCIRLDDEELKQTYQTLELGSRIFIY